MTEAKQHDTEPAVNTATSLPTPNQPPSDPKAAHEAAEAKRKAEWDAKQAEKKTALDKAIADIRAMSDTDAVASAIKKLGDDTERLTRRNMKICVTEHLQALCSSDPIFARKTKHPNKKMANCFKYITRHALEYLKEEARANGEDESFYMRGDSVPDEICYQWAVQYFLDLNAEEDKDKDDEFVPKKYYGSSSTKSKKSEPAKVSAPAKQQVGLNLGGSSDDSI